jgi:hypothetical protein
VFPENCGDAVMTAGIFTRNENEKGPAGENAIACK